MESNDELKEIDIKNCYYFDDIIKIEDFDFNNLLLDEKSYRSILIYDILYKTLIGANPLLIRFDKVDRFIRNYDRTRYLVLFGSEKYDAIYNRIRYLESQKSGIIYVFSHNYAKIKVDSYDSLPLEKILTFYVIILIKSVFSKNQNHYYYNIFLENLSYQLPKITIINKYIYNCYIMTELTFLKVLMLIKEVNQKSVIFVTLTLSKVTLHCILL